MPNLIHCFVGTGFMISYILSTQMTRIVQMTTDKNRIICVNQSYLCHLCALLVIYFKNGNRSLIPRKPVCPAVYSAASTAPKAKPRRFFASWVMVMLSASES